MKIYLARHGQSRWQVTKDDSDWNSPLTDLGQNQAALLAEWLARHPAVDHDSRVEIGSLRVSPLVRAQQTAEPTAARLHIPLVTDAALQEADFYVSEHLPVTETPYQAQPVYTPKPVYAQFKQQAAQALNALVADVESSQQPVLGVAHGGLISTLLRQAVGSDAISFWIYNTTLSLLEWKRGRWHMVYLNLWDHLPPELRTF